MSGPSFRERFSLDDRVTDRRRALVRRPGYVPVVVEAAQRGFERRYVKCLLHRDVRGQHLQDLMRQKFGVAAEDAIFLVCGGAIVQHADTMRDLAARYVDSEDGFLYMGCMRENTFG